MSSNVSQIIDIDKASSETFIHAEWIRKKKFYREGDMPPHVAEARHRAYALPEVENPTLRLPGSRVALHGR